MTNEEFEKRKEFILDQQAQFAVDIQQLRESQAELQAAQVRTEQVVVQTGEIVARLANGTLEGFRDVNAKINSLVDAQIRTDEKINALADSQMQTDGDLRNLIAVVDRYFSEGRNLN
jgi:hypothetical protein